MNRIEGIAQFNKTMNEKQDYFVIFKRRKNEPRLDMLHLNRDSIHSFWVNLNLISRAKGYTEFKLEFIYD